MNILMFGGLAPWLPGAYGGYIANFQLARALAKTGHGIDYVAIAPKNLRKEIEWGKILYLSPANTYVLPFMEYFKTRKSLAKYDIVVTHGGEGFIHAIHRKMFNDPKLVVINHAALLRNFPWRMASPTEPLEWLSVRGADLVFCVSEFQKKNLSESYHIPLSRVRVLYLGVDDSFLSTPVPARSEKGPFSLLFIGRLRGHKQAQKEQKGLDILLQAIPLILREHSVVLNIIGGGGEAPRYREWAKKLGVDKHVTFLGYVPYDQMPQYYANADLLVAPSRREGFSLVLLEAMASGLPVVSTTATSIPEAVEHGETGIVVPPNDPQRLAEAVNALLSNPQRMRVMGLKGRERVKRLFTWDKVAERAIGFFREIL